MKKIYFVHYDKTMRERQSDGVEFCVIPEFHDNKIYFYCSEYMIFWKSIEDVGIEEKCCSYKLKNVIRPATLEEICKNNIIHYVDSIKEYTINNGKLSDIRYIHLHEYTG